MIDPKRVRLIGQFPSMRTGRASLEVMRMESRSYMPGPWLLPVAEHWGTRYVVDLELYESHKVLSAIPLVLRPICSGDCGQN